MVDTALYTGSTAANQTLLGMSLIANNLANLNTPGFYADYKSMVAVNVQNKAAQTRVMATTDQTYTDLRQGPINYTGRDLDVAINGPGYIAVQNKDGTEAYTRAGSMEITSDGLLITSKGDLVLGANGVITIPPASSVSIDNSGIVYARLKGDAQTAMAEIGRIKTVKISGDKVAKGADGLFYPTGDATAEASLDVKMVPESLEGSNVEAVRSLTELIDTSRQFDIHTKIMDKVDENAAKANQMLDMKA